MDIFILHALTGSAAQAVRGEKCEHDLKCVAINMYAKAGTISEINGLAEIAAMEDCCFTLQKARIGETCDDSRAILTQLCRVYFCNDSIEKLRDDVMKMNELFQALDENGNDLVYDRVDPEYIVSWWAGNA